MRRMVRAAVIAALCATGATAVSAQDLAYGEYDPYAATEGYQSYKDDYSYSTNSGRRRYCPNGTAQAYDPYADNYDSGYAVAPYQDDYVDEQPLPYASRSHCLRSGEVENALVRQGWRNFRAPEKGVDVVGLTASRPNGLTYRLKLDRCTGVIIAAYLLDQKKPHRKRNRNIYSSTYYVPSY